MTNEDLVRKAQTGHVPSREALARRWLGRAYGAALAFTGSAHDADDLVQEAFLRAFARLHTLRDPARFGPWLLRILRNAGRDRHRRRRAAQLGGADAALHGAPTPTPEGDALRAWRALPDEQRLVTWLKVMDAYRLEDIAELLGSSRSAVHRTLHKGLARLRRELSRC